MISYDVADAKLEKSVMRLVHYIHDARGKVNLDYITVATKLDHETIKTMLAKNGFKRCDRFCNYKKFSLGLKQQNKV